MSNLVENVLPQEYIDYLINLPEVKEAKEQIDRQKEGKIYFTVNLTPSIKAYLTDQIGLDLKNVNNIPMRWIKGDTKPHNDLSTRPFEKTYLAYLTDSSGELIVDGNNYAIKKGCGYVFSEGLKHETVGTGSEPRLLLGPMSETGISVGSSFTYPGGTTVYMRQILGVIQFKVNESSWSPLGNNYPISITNDDTSKGLLTIEFITDITFDNSSPGGTEKYFICSSSHIKFGSTSLNADGTRPIITIDGVLDYPGLIKNGTNAVSGYGNIYIYNLKVIAINGATLISQGGWIGQIGFGRGAVGNNYIVNCSSTGDIGNPSINSGGGILGDYAAVFSSSVLTLIGCSSSGNIGGNGGGILGQGAATSGGIIVCEKCWSIGTISNRAGGIIGPFSAGPNGSVTVTNCYSEGNQTDEYAGGIYGSQVGAFGGTAQAINCYSLGNIWSGGGGIFGASAGQNGSAIAQNCYSVGTWTGGTRGIYGETPQSGAIEQNCYSANGTWLDSSAEPALIGAPNGGPNLKVGPIWVSVTSNQPYELKNMGYSPYSPINIIITASVPNLNQIYSESVEAGLTSDTALISDLNYTILQKEDGNPGSYDTIGIQNNTGRITTTNSTTPGSYTIYIRNNGSYNITTFGLTVTPTTVVIDGDSSVSVPPCCQPICTNLNQTTDNTQERRAVRKSGVAIAVDVDRTYLAINQNRSVNLLQPAFKTYSDYMTYLQSRYR